MPRFFIPADAVCGDTITVNGSDALHIGRSLRMKCGDSITFCREGTDHSCTILRITGDSVICHIDDTRPISGEPRLRLTLFQALPKQDKSELIIQKATELGAARIVFFLSKRCVSRPDEKSAAKKIERYRKIAEAAAKQSGRGIIPQIDGIIGFSDALREMESITIKLICYENGGARLSEIDFSDVTDCGVMIGAEGGFEHSEIAATRDCGCIPIWLGERILRCETCPIAVTAIIMNKSGDL